MQPKRRTGSASKGKQDEMARSTDSAAPAAPSSPAQSTKKRSGIGSVIALWGPLLVVGLVIWIYGGQDRDSGAIEDPAAVSSSGGSETKTPQPTATQRANEASSPVGQDVPTRPVASVNVSSPAAELSTASGNASPKRAMAARNVAANSPAVLALDGSESETQTPDGSVPAAASEVTSQSSATSAPGQQQVRPSAQDTRSVSAPPTIAEVSPQEGSPRLPAPASHREALKRSDIDGADGASAASSAERADNTVQSHAKTHTSAAQSRPGLEQKASKGPSMYYYPPQRPLYHPGVPTGVSYPTPAPLVTGKPPMPPCPQAGANPSRIDRPCIGRYVPPPYAAMWNRPGPYAQGGYPARW